jgi:hypothetical protein
MALVLVLILESMLISTDTLMREKEFCRSSPFGTRKKGSTPSFTNGLVLVTLLLSVLRLDVT